MKPGDRAMGIVLLVAMAPALFWVGHWALRVPVPGTDAYIAVGMRAEHEAQREDGGHATHCHGDASCADAPPAPVGMGFGLLGEALALLGATGLMVLAAAAAFGPGRGVHVRPPLPPPRRLTAG